MNPSNISKLKVAWRWNSPDNAILAARPDLFATYNEATPLAIDGYLYVSTAMSQVVKINGRTGKTVWTFDPKAYKIEIPPNLGFVHRGLTYWKSASGKTQRILVGTGDAYLIAISPKTGRPIQSFGTNGRVDLIKGLNLDGTDWPSRWQYGVTSPVTICKDVIIVGSSIMDGAVSAKAVRGDVRGFDVRTGKIVWTFHTIPTDTEFGVDTWLNGSHRYTGNTNVWSMTSADEARGLVYLPVSTPTNDWYGGKRPGDNLFAESLVCLECTTGLRKWHFQMVHHGIWDYDLPAAPNLVDIEVGGKKIPAVVQVSKQAFTYVFNRETGEPVWPIEERPVPQSLVEASSPTQPFPSKPPPFDRQGVHPDDLIDFSPELRSEALTVLSQYNLESDGSSPLFSPPTTSKKGTLIAPGWIGGASWSGAAFHPRTQRLYVTSITKPWVGLLTPSTLGAETDPAMGLDFVSGFFSRYVTGPDGQVHDIPLFKPPYGRVTAIDLNKGDTLWMSPLGKGPIEHPKLKSAIAASGWKNQNLGWDRRGHMLLTDQILFIGQSGDFVAAGFSPRFHALKFNIIENEDEQNLKSFDPETGALLAETDLAVDSNGTRVPGASGNAYGAPMTFLDQKGVQVIVVPVGGANKPAELVGLSIE